MKQYVKETHAENDLFNCIFIQILTVIERPPAPMFLLGLHLQGLFENLCNMANWNVKERNL